MKPALRQNTFKNKALVIFVSYISLMMLGIYIAFFQYTVLSITDKFLLSAGMVGLFVAIQSIGMVVSPFILGLLSAKIGKKKTILLAYAIMIAGMLAAGGSGSPASYIASILLVGSGYAVLEATTSAVLADEFSSRSSLHLNFSQVFFSGGAFAGPLIAEWLIDKQGIYFQNLYFFIAAVFFVLALISLAARHYGDDISGKQVKIFSVVGKLRNRVILFLIIAIFLYVGIENTEANYIDSYFEVQLSMPQLSHTALSFYWLAMAASRLLAGALVKNSKTVFSVFSAIAIAALFLAMLLPDPKVKVAMFAVCGFGCGPIWPFIMDSIAKKSKGYTAPMLNITFSFCGLGAALLPLAAGLLVNAASQSAAYYMCAAASILMLAFFLLARSHEKKSLL